MNWTKKGDTQYTRQEDTSPFLSPKETLYVQSVVGTLLYYARVIELTMLPALNQIGAQQSQPTQNQKNYNAFLTMPTPTKIPRYTSMHHI